MTDPQVTLQQQAAAGMSKAAHVLLHAAAHVERGEIEIGGVQFKNATELIKSAATTMALILHERDMD